MSAPTRGERPRVSIVVSTDGRAEAVKSLVSSLRRLDYGEFEVCLVCGPTADGTREYAETIRDKVKVSYCPERNLSHSRNIGIAAAAGEIIAFIDDDGIPEPEWLSELVQPYARAEVGGSGGLVYDHTGAALQYRFAACDRLGNARLHLDHPLSENNYPFATVFPYVQGTNCSFRREALVALGGFDEEYEFYLDETDLCCRLIDSGRVIAQLDGAYVHHKFLPSSIRNSSRVTVKKYAVIKNKIYFSLVCNLGHFSLQSVMEDSVRFIQEQRNDLLFHLKHGRIAQADLDAFEKDADLAWKEGLVRGLSGRRRTRPREFFAEPPPFLAFPAIIPTSRRRTLVFLSQTYGGSAADGVSRYTHDVAQALGARGHNVHVITRGADYDRVDLETDVWVHRLVDREQLLAPKVGDHQIPQHIWARSATALKEIERISAHRTVDIVEAASWDCEGAATLLDGAFPVALNVVTTLKHWLGTHPELTHDKAWMGEFGEPMISVERFMFEGSRLVICASRAIDAEIKKEYEIEFCTGAVSHCPHGLMDMRPLPRLAPAVMIGRQGVKPVLYVGRLELRKGIDILLEAAPAILGSDPAAEIWIAGRPLPISGELTAEDLFAQSPENERFAGRVHFLGEVDDAELRWLYGACLLVAVPSRFESFGLVVLEAAMFCKPAVAAKAGGLVELVEDQVTGELVDTADAAQLAKAIGAVLKDDARRQRMGAAARERFERLYLADAAAERRLAAYAPFFRENEGA